MRPLLVALAAAAVGVAPPADADLLAPFPHPRGYPCPRAAGTVVIDGHLSDPAWQAAPWSDDFMDIEGDRRPRPRHRTRVKMLWDADALYIAAELDEPHVWAAVTDHDAVVFQDPDFEVFLDPDGDGHLYAELELNARNTTWDLLLPKPYKDGGRAVNGWEVIGLRTAVAVHGTLNDSRDVDRGWTVEIRWPWAGLKELAANVPPRPGDRWRIDFSRVEWDVDAAGQKVPNRPEHNWVWSPTGVIDMHRPERWGYVQFVAAAGEGFRPDPLWEVRDRLHRGYYAQRVHKARTGGFAAELPALTVERTARGFLLAAGGLTIDDEARVR